MSNVISRLMYYFPTKVLGRSVLSATTIRNFGQPSMKEDVTIRNFGQPSMKEDVEVEEDEVDFDQRMLPADHNLANFDPTEHRSPPTDKVWRLVDEISGLKLGEVAELSSILMKKLVMKELPVVGVMKPGAAGFDVASMKPSA